MPDYFQSDRTIYIFPPELWGVYFSIFLSTLLSFLLELSSGCEVTELHGFDLYLVAQGLP